MKSYFKFSIVSVAAAAFLTACGGGSGSSTTDSSTNTSNNTSISGKAVDGYLRYSSICLDLNNDGYCQASSEPMSTTLKDGSYSLTLTNAQKSEYPEYSKSNLIVYGGQDSDTLKDFSGKLTAPFSSSGAIYVSPITTMVVAIQKASGSSLEEAKQKASSILGVTVEDVTSDPVAKAKEGDSKALKAALQVQKMVEVLVKAAKEDTTVSAGKSDNELSEDIFEALAIGASASDLALNDGASISDNLGKVLDKASADTSAQAKMGAKAKQVAAAAKVMAKKVEEAFTGETNLDTKKISQIALQIDKTKESVEQKVDETIDSDSQEDLVLDDEDIELEEVADADVEKELLINALIQSGLSLDDALIYANKILEKNIEFEVGDSFEDLQKELEEANHEELADITEVIKDKAEEIKEEIVAVEKPNETLNSIDDILSVTKVATVEHAKNLFSTLRTTAKSFLDEDENGNIDSSTIVGIQDGILKEKVKPEVENFVNRLETSADNVTALASAFGDSIETNFKTTVDALGERLDLISAILDSQVEDASWGPQETTAGDIVSQTYTLNESNQSIKVITITNQDTSKANIQITITEDILEEEIVSVNIKEGDNVFKDINYDLKIKSLSFDDNAGIKFKFLGSINGENNSNMNLTDLSISLDFNENSNKDNASSFENISFVFDGQINSDGRVLNGSLTLDESDSSKNAIAGKLVGLENEPTIEGVLKADINMDAMKESIDDEDDSINNWSWGTLALFSYEVDGERKYFIEIDREESKNKYTYGDVANISTKSFISTLHDGSKLNCEKEEKSNNLIYGQYTQKMNCTVSNVKDGTSQTQATNVQRHKIYEDYIVDVTLSNQQKAKLKFSGYNNNINLVNEDGHYIGSLDSDTYNVYLWETQEKVTVADISIRKAKLFENISNKFTLTAKVTDGNNVFSIEELLVSQKALAKESVASIKNLSVTDGLHTISVEHAALIFNTELYDANMTKKFDGTEYVYNEYEWDDYKSDTLKEALLKGFKADLKIDEKDFVINADLDLHFDKNEDLKEAIFDGLYSYDGTSLNGLIEIKNDFKEYSSIKSIDYLVQVNTIYSNYSEDKNDVAMYKPSYTNVGENKGSFIFIEDTEKGSYYEYVGENKGSYKRDFVEDSENGTFYKKVNKHIDNYCSTDIFESVDYVNIGSCENKTYSYANKEYLPTGSASMKVEVVANGFEPFSLEGNANMSEATSKASILFTQGSGENQYKLAIKGTLDNTLKSASTDEEERFKVQMGDSNGVKFSYESTEGENEVYSIKNINGEELATYGKNSTGNDWEIVYSDGTSETGF